MCRKKKLLVVALAGVVLAALLCIWYPEDSVNPDSYDRIVKGMSEEDVEAILSPGALQDSGFRAAKSREIASILGTIGVGREVKFKQLPNLDAEIYDKNTGEFLGKSRSWEGYRYRVVASFDSGGKLDGKQLYEYDGPPVTSNMLFVSRVIVSIRGLCRGYWWWE